MEVFVHTHSARKPLCAAGFTVALTAALAACGSQSAGTGSTSAASTTPMAAVKLAAQTSDNANSFTGTMSLRATTTTSGTSSEDTSFSASFAEQLHPSLLAQVNLQSISAAGTTLPGAMTELLTPSTLYMKWAYLTQQLHITKPWLVIPLGQLSKTSGVNFSQLVSEASDSSPLAESQLLSGATSVRKVGTGTVDGVATTEYTGQLSLDKAIKHLPASDRAAMQKVVTTSGLSTATFTVWIDGSSTVRKAIISEHGPAVTETITVEITSINQPVNVSVPNSSQTASLPTSTLQS
jgi:hypothetical protein